MNIFPKITPGYARSPKKNLWDAWGRVLHGVCPSYRRPINNSVNELKG